MGSDGGKVRVNQGGICGFLWDVKGWPYVLLGNGNGKWEVEWGLMRLDGLCVG